MSRVLVATRNAKKLAELQKLLAPAGGISFETLATHSEVGEVDETGASFDANARKKASECARASGLWAIGEDSGLEVTALGGAPGVRSARYAGEPGSDRANSERVLNQMEGVFDRSARFVCSIALARPDGEVVATAYGVCGGRLAESPRGTNGFGYDSIVIADALPGRTLAELTSDEKAEISHRGAALRAFLPLLRAHRSAMG